ncbi:cupin domain-containing protein [Sinorhizobium americanum]|uniref:Cupin domain-containing protein n=1 Tax=Sinorhizobium americanum TaxID=194963 RepID=A0A4V2RE79_9HYPH|nr:cupin domain-containing protein [Sinorhizobium americanum]TCN27630.1 hypothetical protein EV184_11588 [Sinorhizobium americanum]
MKPNPVAALALGLFLSPSFAGAQQQAQEPKYVVKPLAEKKVSELPAGELFWRVENFATVAQAQAAMGPNSLVAESRGKVWLFTLGPAGQVSTGGTKVAEIGPIPKVEASQYLLRINEAGGPPGTKTPVHTHPGPEAFYVLAGETSQKTPHGVNRVGAGQSMVGHGDTPMEVWSSGSTETQSLVMFVVDATKPFSSPAKFD